MLEKTSKKCYNKKQYSNFCYVHSFLCKCKKKGLAMALQKEKMRLITALGMVEYGEKAVVRIPRSKRTYYIQQSKNGIENKELKLDEIIELTPFSVQKDASGNIFICYIAGLGKNNQVSFVGQIGAKYAQRVLNEICSDIFSKDGVIAKGLSVNDIRAKIKNDRIRGIDIPGSYWLSTVFFQNVGGDNRAYGIYSLDNGFLNKVYMYDDKKTIEPSQQRKQIVAFIKVKVDMDRTKKLNASC